MNKPQKTDILFVKRDANLNIRIPKALKRELLKDLPPNYSLSDFIIVKLKK